MTKTYREPPRGIPSVTEMHEAHAKAILAAKAKREFFAERQEGAEWAIRSRDDFGEYMRLGPNEDGEWTLSAFVEQGSIKEAESRRWMCADRPDDRTLEAWKASPRADSEMWLKLHAKREGFLDQLSRMLREAGYVTERMDRSPRLIIRMPPKK